MDTRTVARINSAITPPTRPRKILKKRFIEVLSGIC
jgi:hypothetical protein